MTWSLKTTVEEKSVVPFSWAPVAAFSSVRMATTASSSVSAADHLAINSMPLSVNSSSCSSSSVKTSLFDRVANFRRSLIKSQQKKNKIRLVMLNAPFNCCLYSHFFSPFIDQLLGHSTSSSQISPAAAALPTLRLQQMTQRMASHL